LTLSLPPPPPSSSSSSSTACQFSSCLIGLIFVVNEL
jgi:hypothetical protein